MKSETINKYKPAVNRSVLYFMAGLAWSAVGIMLIKKAAGWIFSDFNSGFSYFILISGLIPGIVIAIFGFSKVADKNINRIKNNGDKRCIFGFIAWKSYLLIAFMVGLGITLRHSSLPKTYLSVLYNGIGAGLFLASFKYFREIF